MAGSQASEHGIIAGINVTPLVDVVLVLLIIFIVTARVVTSPALPLDLPQAATGQQTQVVLSVAVWPDGHVSVDGETVRDLNELTLRARAAVSKQPEQRVVISADGSVPHRRVMGVMDALRAAGIERLAFASAPIDSTPPAVTP